MHKYVHTLLITISLLSLAGVVFMLGQQWLKQSAVDGCLQTSLYRSQREENGYTITTEEPIQKAVEACLELKSIK